MKPLQFFSSTIGKKFLVAISGLFMIFYLILHLAGNLEIFSGPSAVNQYASFLRTIPKALWAFRIALIAAVVIHIWATMSLARLNNQARIDPYHLKKSRKANLSSRTMMVSGLTILAFVLYHLAHYTIFLVNPEFHNLVDAQGRHHVYNMMVLGFSHPLVSAFYVVAQILLACHLYHGVSSALRTLGLADHVLYEKMRILGMIFATLMAVLFITIPISVLFGFLPFDYS